MENPIITEVNELLGDLLQPSLPECYKEDHSFVSLSSAAKCQKCTVEDVEEQVKKGKFGFAQTLLIDTEKYLDGREFLRKPVFRITDVQVGAILDKDGYIIDLDTDLNGWLWSCPPRQVRVEVKDLRVLLPNCDLSDYVNSSEPEQCPVEANTSSVAAKNLKKRQTTDIDAKSQEIISVINNKVREHMGKGREEMVINHTRFIDEAGICQGKDRDRAFKLVKEYISNYEGDLRYHGFKYANKPVRSGRPYFLTDEEGLKQEA
ncbi:MAG: hypothetical protein PHR66_07855 [Desulfuromonadaceae bacterium]|nr:hypothetical protein [Desulfuromonadaceae bacterium]